MNTQTPWLLSLLALPALLCMPACKAPEGVGYNIYNPNYTPQITITAPGGGPSFGAELLPLAEGNQWSYQVDQDNTTGHRFPQPQFIKVWPDRQQGIYEDQAWRVKYQTAQGAVDTYLKIDERGVWSYGDHLATRPSPLPWLLFPVRVGQQWESRNETMDLLVRGEVETMEAVGTPLGVFQALLVRIDALGLEEGSTLQESERLWFVPGLGIIRRIVYRQPLLGEYLLRDFTVAGADNEQAREEARVK